MHIKLPPVSWRAGTSKATEAETASTHVISYNARALSMLTHLKKHRRTRPLSEVTSPTTASFSDTSVKNISVYCVGELLSHSEYRSIGGVPNFHAMSAILG